MSAMAFQITGVSIVFSTVDQIKHQSSVSMTFVRGIHQSPVDSPHKGPVTGKCFHLMTSSWIWFCKKYTRRWVSRELFISSRSENRGHRSQMLETFSPHPMHLPAPIPKGRHSARGELLNVRIKSSLWRLCEDLKICYHNLITAPIWIESRG